MSVVDDIVFGMTKEEDIQNATNLDSITTLIHNSEASKDVSKADIVNESSSTLEQGDPKDGKKRMRYDKLGRLIEVEVVSERRLGVTLTSATNSKILRRPRGRPPRGKPILSGN